MSESARDHLAESGRKSGLNQDMLRARGHRPSGQEQERARFNVKRRLGANPRTGFRQGIRRWYWIASDQKYDDAKQVSGQTRSDRDWYPSVGRDGALDR